jgi:hypothetical protein
MVFQAECFQQGQGSINVPAQTIQPMRIRANSKNFDARAIFLPDISCRIGSTIPRWIVDIWLPKYLMPYLQ